MPLKSGQIQGFQVPRQDPGKAVELNKSNALGWGAGAWPVRGPEIAQNDDILDFVIRFAFTMVHSPGKHPDGILRV